MLSNTELLSHRDAIHLLTPAERLRLFALLAEGAEGRGQPCPHCRRTVTRWEALGLALNDYDPTKHHEGEQCQHCAGGLSFRLPLACASVPFYWMPDQKSAAPTRISGRAIR